jgi:hypothetical protein
LTSQIDPSKKTGKKISKSRKQKGKTKKNVLFLIFGQKKGLPETEQGIEPGINLGPGGGKKRKKSRIK